MAKGPGSTRTACDSGSNRALQWLLDQRCFTGGVKDGGKDAARTRKPQNLRRYEHLLTEVGDRRRRSPLSCGKRSQILAIPGQEFCWRYDGQLNHVVADHGSRTDRKRLRIGDVQLHELDLVARTFSLEKSSNAWMASCSPGQRR